MVNLGLTICGLKDADLDDCEELCLCSDVSCLINVNYRYM